MALKGKVLNLTINNITDKKESGLASISCQYFITCIFNTYGNFKLFSISLTHKLVKTGKISTKIYTYNQYLWNNQND